MIYLEPVDKSDIFTVYPDIQKQIDEISEASNGTLTSENIMEEVNSGRYYLVVIKDEKHVIIASIIMFVEEYVSGKRVLMLSGASGKDMNLWLELILDFAQGLARELSCEDIYVVGRKGWQKVLEPFGYEHAHTWLHCPVRGEA